MTRKKNERFYPLVNSLDYLLRNYQLIEINVLRQFVEIVDVHHFPAEFGTVVNISE